MSDSQFQTYGSLVFNIEKNEKKVIDNIFKVTTDLKFKAFQSRIEREYTKVNNHKTVLEIRNPIELSAVSGIRAVSREEEAPIAFKIVNLSQSDIGR